MSNAKKAAAEKPAEPVPYYVVITVCDLETGQAVPVSRIDCRDLLHARNLLSEMGELAQDIAEFVPGMVATGFELGEPKLQSFADMIETGSMNKDDKQYWRDIIAEEQAENLLLAQA